MYLQAEHLQGILFAFLAALFWGLSPILNKKALQEMGLWKTNAFRGAGAIVLLLLLLPLAFIVNPTNTRELLFLSVSAYLTLVAIAFLNNMVGDVLYLSAIRDVGVSVAAPIASSFPLIVAFISWLWFGEALTFSVLVGTVFVVGGLALLNRRAAEARTDSRYLRGVTASALTALCWAVGLTFTKYLTLQGVASESMVFWRGIFVGVMAITLLPVVSKNETSDKSDKSNKKFTFRPPSAVSVFAAMGAGIVGLVVGTWFYISSLLLIPMNVATPISSSGPLVAVVLACVLMGESLRPIQWAGIVLVVSGAVFVSL